MPPVVQWVPEQDAVLEARWKAGISSGSIAREMGKTRNAVLGRLSRLNLLKIPNSVGGRLRALPRVRDESRPKPKPKRPNVGARNASILHRIVTPLHEVEA